MKYRTEVDGLRAIAVILVILRHFWPTLFPGGFIGVDVFFVISGYVISGSLATQLQNETFIRRLGAFYIRRIRRILPLVVVVFISVTFFLSLFKIDVSNDLNIGLLSLAGLANIGLYIDEANYWSTGNDNNAFLHAWSLGVEEQFYLILPLMFLLILNKSSKTVVMATLMLGSLYFFSITDFIDNYESYYNTAIRAWELLLGVLIYYFSIKIVSINENARKILIFLLIVMLFLLAKSEMTVNVQIISSVFISASLIILILASETPRSVLGTTPMVWLGKRSFSIYMWHWPVIVIVGLIFSTHLYGRLLAIILTITLSVLSYKYIEVPFRNKYSLRYYVLFLWVSMTALSVLLVNIIDENSLYTGKDLPPKELTKELTSDQIYKNINCTKELGRGDVVRVIGNSHAIIAGHSIRLGSRKCGFTLKTPSGGSGDNYEWGKMPLGNNYDENKLSKIFQDKELKLIVISSRWRQLYKDSFLSNTGKLIKLKNGNDRRRHALDTLLKELDYIIAEAEKNKIKVLFIMPSIESNIPVKKYDSNCVQQWFQVFSPSGCNIKIDKVWLRRRFSNEFYQEIALRQDRYPFFSVFNSMDYLCKSDFSCDRVVDGYNLLRDTNHLSPNAMLIIANPMINKINQLMVIGK